MRCGERTPYTCAEQLLLLHEARRVGAEHTIAAAWVRLQQKATLRWGEAADHASVGDAPAEALALLPPAAAAVAAAAFQGAAGARRASTLRVATEAEAEARALRLGHHS